MKPSSRIAQPRSLGAIAIAVALLLVSSNAPAVVDSSASRKEAVAKYPSLGKAGTPLNRKFLELYRKAKEANSPALDNPDWPMALAKKAAAVLAEDAAASKALNSAPIVTAPVVPALPPPPFKVEQTHFKVPVGEPPEFDPTLPHGGKWQYREFTLNAQVIPAPSQIVPDGSGAGDAPPVWRTLGELRHAAKAQDLTAFKSLFLPEIWTREIQPALDRGGEASVMRHLTAMAGDPRVPLIIEADGLIIPILDAGGGRVSSLPLRPAGNALLIDEPKNLPPPTSSALNDLEFALRAFPIEELIVK